MNGSEKHSILPLQAASDAPAHPSRSTHVLLVIDGFPKVLGGGERVLLRTAAGLVEAGYRVSVLTFRIDPECTALAEATLPCPLYLLPLTSTYNLAAWKAALLLRRFLRTHHVAIVQTFFESSDLWAGAVVKLCSDARLIWSRRDMGILRGRKHRLAYRLLRRLPDHVFAVSEQVRRYCIDTDGIDPERVETLYNGIDLEGWTLSAAPEREDRDDAPVIVTLGNIRRVKGHDVLIAAAAPVLQRFPAATFRIAGEILEPAFFAELQAQLETLGIADRFEFVGNVTDLRPFLLGADLFVLPSRSEGFSNAVLEAMAASLAVVATDVGGNREAVEDGETGSIVPAEDPGRLAEATLHWLLDPQARQRAGAAGRQRVADRFSSAAILAQVTRAYTRLLTL